MKYVLIWWMFYALSGAPATSSAVFDSDQACHHAGSALAQASATNGRVVRYICVPQGDAADPQDGR